MNPTTSKAIRRTFADVYSVSPETVDVVWADDGESITVRCAGKTFRHQTNTLMTFHRSKLHIFRRAFGSV
jgi:hypothetical protein